MTSLTTSCSFSFCLESSSSPTPALTSALLKPVFDLVSVKSTALLETVVNAENTASLINS